MVSPNAILSKFFLKLELYLTLINDRLLESNFQDLCCSPPEIQLPKLQKTRENVPKREKQKKGVKLSFVSSPYSFGPWSRVLKVLILPFAAQHTHSERGKEIQSWIVQESSVLSLPLLLLLAALVFLLVSKLFKNDYYNDILDSYLGEEQEEVREIEMRSSTKANQLQSEPFFFPVHDRFRSHQYLSIGSSTETLLSVDPFLKSSVSENDLEKLVLEEKLRFVCGKQFLDLDFPFVRRESKILGRNFSDLSYAPWLA